ncbi:MAG: glycosyltransferase family 4 protein [Planctomycetota bacterium]
MRLLITSDYLNPTDIGGSGRVLLEVARHLVSRGHEVEFLTGSEQSGNSSFVFDGVTFTWTTFAYPRTGSRGLRSAMRVRSEIRRVGMPVAGSAEVVLHVQPFTAAALTRCPTPSVYLFLSPWPLEYLAERAGTDDPRRVSELGLKGQLAYHARRRVEGKAVRGADRWVTISQVSRRHLSELHGIPADAIPVAYPAVDTVAFQPVDDAGRRAQRERWGIADGELMIACVRRLVARTGVDLLLHAFAAIAEQLPKARLLIAGKGAATDDLHALHERLDLGDQVRFLGYVADEELPGLYQGADLTVMPTRALEGFGLATVESMACGTPVIATPVGGSTEILEPFEASLLCEDVTPAALAATLLHWGDRAKLAQLRDRCRSYVTTTYSWKHMTDAIEAQALTLERAVAAPA